MPPLVSILIPAYNSERCLGATLESALAQTWSPKEIIVVDDGSKDRTLEVARAFENRGVTVASQPNQGAAAARNKAFSLSKGDYIQWLDADDLVSPDKIERQMEAASVDAQTLLSCGWGYFIHRPQTARFTPTALWANLSPGEWLIRKLDLNLHMQTATWLVSRQLTEAAGPWDIRLLGDDDGEYFCRVLMKSATVRFVPGPKVFYRRTTGSLSYIGRSQKKIEAQFLSMEMHIRYLLSLEDSPRVRSVCLKYLQGYSIFFFPEMPEIMQKAQRLALTLGGKLVTPKLPWKYNWLQKLFGWSFAKRAWVCLPAFKESFVRRLDRTLARSAADEARRDLVACHSNDEPCPAWDGKYS